MSPIMTVLCMAPYQTLFMNSPKPKCIKHVAKNFMDSPEQKKIWMRPMKIFHE